MIEKEYLQDAAESFVTYKKLAEKSFAQVSDDEFFQALDDESNSLAVIAKHIGGNLRSRWRDFLTTDGEKPDRNRDSEFVAETDTRETVMTFWREGWEALLATLDSLQPADLQKTVIIRGENHSVVKAINRSMMHTASHVGQIVFLAKHLRSAEWQTLSIPRNRSREFEAFVKNKGGEQADVMENWQNFTAQNQTDGEK